MAKVDYKKAKEVTEQANMKEQPKRGRPIKAKQRADIKISINVTPDEKKMIDKYIEKNYTTIAGTIKRLLKQEKIIK